MNIFRATKIENIECENQAKFVQERILATEEKLATLCSTFGAYLQKSCRVRDATDDIASSIFKYASEETINNSLKLNLVKFAGHMATIGDLKENEISHIEQNVAKQFLQYNTLCRNAKTELRGIFSAKERELSRRRHLGKVRQKDPHNRTLITKAESELSKAAAESSQVQRALEEHIEIFERKKLTDIKQILIGFVMTELRFHSEAIEVYTDAYKTLMKINIEDDFQAFQNILKQSPVVSRLEIVRRSMGPSKSAKLPLSQSSFTTEENSLSKILQHTTEHEEVESCQEESSEEYSSEVSLTESETKSKNSDRAN